MALQTMLGLLSESILHYESAEEVAAKIAAVPGLSPEEREDLRRIPHDRLNAYQHDIYMADRNMLEWGFANTWRCLEQLQFGEARAEPGDAEREFVLRFKRNYPCATHSVREMGAHFVKYLARDCTALCQQYPWLLELAEAELLEIEVLYAADSPHGTAPGTPEREAFFAQSLGDLLERRIVRAEAVRVLAVAHDLAAVKRTLASAEADEALDFTKAPFLPSATPMFFAIARDHASLEPVWYRADAGDAAFVPALSEQRPQTVESHAEAVLANIAPAGMPEADQLSQYLILLERALRLRYALVA